MSESSQLRFGKSFSELHYKFGRTLDGISRTPGALTTENTYRMIHGFPEVYVTCIYRWLEWPTANYISQKAIELGKRLGKNSLIVPIEGYEEQFWADAREFMQTVAAKIDHPLELNDARVYLLISSCHPRSLLEEASPFLLCDVSDLSSAEFVGFFSKLLDLFNVELEYNLNPFKKREKSSPTPGKALLDSPLFQDNKSYGINQALKVLSEIAFVLDKIEIHFCGFQWPVQNQFKTLLDEIYTTPDLYTKLKQVRKNFKRLKSRKISEEQQASDDRGHNIFIHESEVTIGKSTKEVKDMSKISVQLGDGAIIHGDFVVASKIKDSFNKVDASNVSDNLKELLKNLATEVGKMSEHLPEEQAEQVANDLQTFTNEATNEKPRRKWWQLSAEGIKEAAKTVGEIGLSVLKNLDKIIPILDNLS